MVLLSAQGMDVAAIARAAFTSEDRVRDVIRNFNADGLSRDVWPLSAKRRGRRSAHFDGGKTNRCRQRGARTGCHVPQARSGHKRHRSIHKAAGALVRQSANIPRAARRNISSPH
jgi:hypothetical protein